MEERNKETVMSHAECLCNSSRDEGYDDRPDTHSKAARNPPCITSICAYVYANEYDYV